MVMRDRLKLVLPPELTRQGAFYAHRVSCDRALFIFVRDHLTTEMLELLTRNARVSGADQEMYSQTLLQMVLARAIDTFQTYFADVVEAVLLLHPELLSNEAKINYGDILAADSLMSLRETSLREVVRKKVDNLSYAGYAEFAKWFALQNVRFTVSASEHADIVEWIAARNVIVHNHGHVNERYLNAVPDSAYDHGERLILIPAEVASTHRILTDIVFRMDPLIATHFGLKLQPPQKWETSFPVLAHPPEPWQDEPVDDYR